MKYSIKIPGKHYDLLRSHLYPGDDREAVAIALCGRYEYNNEVKLLVHEIIPIPYDVCKVREEGLITWPPEYLVTSLTKANKYDFSVIKIHCHPGGGEYFSPLDDIADSELFPSIFGWIDNAKYHASCIMLPDGKLVGRVFNEASQTFSVNQIVCVGDSIKIWSNQDSSRSDLDFEIRNRQAFGEGTVNILNNLKIAVIGCSGTGSPVIEQLVRLGVGELLIIDPDELEVKNLNRILNSTMKEAKQKLKKVRVLADAYKRIGLNTKIEAIDKDIYSEVEIIRKIASCDFVFGCSDTVDSRHLLNQISTFYLVPYIDIGVFLKSDGNGGVDYISGQINYLQPGGSSLLSRGVYTAEELQAWMMHRFNPVSFFELKRQKYIVDVNVNTPAVISVNMQMSSIAVNEFLSRIHNFRGEETQNFAIVRVDILNGYFQGQQDGDPDLYLLKYVGRGDCIKPFLNMSELS